MRFRPGEGRGAGSHEKHDPGSRHAVLQVPIVVFGYDDWIGIFTGAITVSIIFRAPEILMGARHYTAAVDVWSVGCIFGELLSRRILFQAQSPVQQVCSVSFIFEMFHR